MSKDKGSIVLKGGGVLKVIECDDAGSPTGSAVDLGYIETTGLVMATTNDNDVMDETGSVVAHNDGDTSYKLTGTFLQTNKDLHDLIRDSVGKFYQVYYKCTPTGKMNTKTQELFGGIGRFKRQFEIKAGAKKAPFEITFLNNDTAISIATPNTTYGAIATATQTIAIGDCVELSEA